MANDRLSNDLASLKIDRAAQPARRIPRTLIYVGVAAALVLPAYLIGYPAVKSRLFKTEVEVTEISLVSAAQGSIQLTGTGYVVPQTTAKVAAKVAGRIAEVDVHEGDVLTLGQVIARLEDADEKSALASARARATAARARVSTARAQLAETQQQLEREKQLVEKGVSPKATVEDLEARVASLNSAVKAAIADADAADAETHTLEVNLTSYTITAPIAGTVVGTPAKVGELVDPHSDPVVELVDFSTSVVEVDVPETRIGSVEIGFPCQIVLDSDPNHPYQGSVQVIGQRVNRSKATVTVKVKFDEKPQKPIADASARVNFLAKDYDQKAAHAPPKLVVPDSAVIDREGAKVVFVVDSGKVRMQTVSLGEAFGGGHVLTTPMPDGTKVVAHPPANLRDGQSIKEKSS